MRKLISLFSLGAVVLLGSCKKSPEYQPAPYGAPSPLSGVVIALDEFQNPLASQPSINIAIAPDSGSGTTTSTSAQGGTMFTVNDVQGGTYNITVSADGFQPVTRPRYNHGAGTATNVDTLYLIQPSTTTVTDLVPSVREDVAVTRFSEQIILLANTNFPLLSGDSIAFGDGLSPRDPKYLIASQDTNLIYSKDTTLYKPRTIVSRQTFFVVTATLNQPSTDSTMRGAMLVLSSNDNPTAEQYLMLQTQLETKFPASSTYPGEVTFEIPKTQLETAGIISTEPTGNHRVYLAAYGLSGNLFAYGATLSADRSYYIYPSRNQQRSDVKFLDF